MYPLPFPASLSLTSWAKLLVAAGKKQLRIAETEKYPHVTYFFNAGMEKPFPGEDRNIIPSPKVATYDLQPQMSAREVTETVLARMADYDLIILNFANPDMVGHTGVVEAGIKAVETIDACCAEIIPKLLSLGGKCLVTADHGNCELMRNPDGSPNTAHTTNLVHFIYVAEDSSKFRVKDGILADVAPTLLFLLGFPEAGRNVRSEFTRQDLNIRQVDNCYPENTSTWQHVLAILRIWATIRTRRLAQIFYDQFGWNY